MLISTDAKGLDMPWEADDGYALAARTGDTIYVSGQPSHGDRRA